MPTLTESLQDECRTLVPTQRGTFSEDLLQALRYLAFREDGMLSELMAQYGGLADLLHNGVFSKMFNTTVDPEKLLAAINDPSAFGYSPHNLLTYSEEFDNAAWTKAAGAAVIADAGRAPDGTMTADLLYPTTAGTLRALFQAAGASTVVSVWAKAAGASVLSVVDQTGASYIATFDLAAGAITNLGAGVIATMIPDNDGWYRCVVVSVNSLTFAFAQFATQVPVQPGTAGILLWGASGNAGPSEVPYVRTGAAPVGSTVPGWRLSDSTPGIRLSANARASTALQQKQGVVFGQELVTNGNFAAGSAGWTLGAGWTVADGVASRIAQGSNSSITISGLLTVGRRYRIEFDVLSISGGDLRTWAGDSVFSGPITAPGRVSVTLASTAGTGFWITSGAPGTVVSVDNISVREVLVSSEGFEIPLHNLQPQSEAVGGYAAAGTTPPTLGTELLNGRGATSITFEPGSAPGFAGSRAQQTTHPWPITAGTAYTVSARIKLSRPLVTGEGLTFYNTGTFGIGSFGIGPGNSAPFTEPQGAIASTSSGPVPLSGSVYAVVFLAGTLTSPLTVTITEHQANLGTTRTAYLPTEAAARFAPAIDWLGDAVKYGLRSESAATNLLLWSADMSNAAWQVFGTGAVKVGEGAPLGAVPMYRLNVGSVGGAAATASALFQSIAAPVSSTLTVSVIVRAVSGNSPFRISVTHNGNATTDSSSDLLATTAPQRFQFTVNTGAGVGGNIAIRAATAGGVVPDIEVGAFQFELGTEPSSPILTYSVAATRAADTLNIFDFGWLGQSQGAIYAEVLARVIGSNGIASVNDGTGANHADMRTNASAIVGIGGVDLASPTIPAVVAGVPSKTVLSYGFRTAQAARDGSPTSTTGDAPALNRLQLGGLDGGTANNLNGHILALRYGDRALPPAVAARLVA